MVERPNMGVRRPANDTSTDGFVILGSSEQSIPDIWEAVVG